MPDSSVRPVRLDRRLSGTPSTVRRHLPRAGAFDALDDLRYKGSIYEFIGSATGGKVQVDDSLDDTGTDEHGELKYDHPADGHSEAGYLIIDFRACAYNFAALANVSGTYEGDQSVEPSDLASFGAVSGNWAVPHNLILHGGDSAIDTYADTCDSSSFFTINQPDCAALGSGWTAELITLVDCGNTDPVVVDPSSACMKNELPKLSTPGSFTWSLTPIFAKGKKK